MKRQFTIGRISPMLFKLHPELRRLYEVKDSIQLRCFMFVGYLAQVLIPIVRFLDFLGIPLPLFVYRFFLKWYYVRGLKASNQASDA
jgi:hypothetical protein